MLKIYDKNHNAIGHIVKYKDCKIESEVATGDKTLSFVYLAKHHSLQNEMYVQTKDDEYVIKEVPATTGAFPQIVAVLNLEDLQRDMWQTFSVADTTIDEAVRTVLAGTGWTIGECNVTKKRNAGMMQVSTLEVIQNLCTAFMCEPVFDTINKTVSFYSQRGEDKGVYFMSGLNLKKLQKKSTSYDYYTRIIPVGQDSLSIADVNDGKNYLENYQYSNKVLTYIWKDESYTDAQALMEDAQLKLNDLSKPEVSYSADVRDLAKQKSGYNVLSYNLGDTVTIIDQETGTREKQRIKKMVEYPQNPEKNTCEIANTVLTFEEMQQKYQAAINIINNTVTSDGRYTGTINVSDILNFESGIAGSSTISGISNNITGMQGELAGIKLTLGEVETNYLKVDEAELKYATIENLNVVREDVHELNADYGSFKTATADEFAAHTARIDTVVGDLASYKTTVTDELIAAKGWMAEGAIGDAQISSVNANKLQSGTIDTALVTIVGSDGRLQIADNTMQISDANRVRVQVGKDSSGDYTLAVWDKAGNLIWDALGATDKTIQRKIIRDNVIADDAAIQALKIDFQSLDTVLTDQGVTISGTVVQVGSKTLNVALSEQAQINTNYSEKLTSHSSKIAANEKAIALKVSSQTYEKDKTSMESSLQTLESSVNVMDGQITALVQDVTVLQGDYDGLDSRTAKLELDSSNFAVELSSTKKTVSDNYTSLKEYTDSAKASAISAAASDATTKADNALAAAKTDATTKANAALASAMTEIDATNAVVTTHTTTLSKHDTRITANENAISLKVWSQDITDAVAGIEVGGRNLLYETADMPIGNTLSNSARVYGTFLNTIGTGGGLTATEDGIKLTFGSDVNLSIQAPLASFGNVKSGEIITISFTYRGNITNFGSFFFLQKTTPNIQYTGFPSLNNDKEWHEYKHTFSADYANTRTCVSILLFYALKIYDSSYWIEIKRKTLKLERGTKATDWTPAPEDVDSAIATVDGKFASYSTTTEMQSAIEVAKSEINLSVSETYTTKTEFDALEIGGRNLLLKSDVEHSNNDYNAATYVPSSPLTAGETYTITICVTPGTGVEYIQLYLSTGYANQCALYTTGTDKQIISGTFKSKYSTGREPSVNIRYGDIRLYRFPNDGSVTSNTTIHWIKLERGTKPTDWTPAPEDTDSKITTLETWKTEASQQITKDGIIATVGNYYAYQSDLASAEIRITDAETTIAQQADAIALKVSKGDIISTINQSAEEVKINATKITLEGATIADSFTATNLHITGNSVFDGALNGATGTFAGSLSAASGTFKGALSGATGDFSGKITATSGKIGGWVIASSRITSSETIGIGVKEAGVLLVNESNKPFITAQDANGNSRFVVSRDGTVIATNATVTGDITANSLAAKCTIYLQNPNNTSAGSSAISYDGAKLILNGDYGGNQIGNGTINYGPLWVYGSGIELHYSTPYIDFHYGNSTSDYTSRIIEESSGVLAFTGAIRPYGGVITESGSYRKPVGSSNVDGNKCGIIKSNKNSSGTYYFTLGGQWNTAGADFTNKTFTATTSDIRLKDNIVDSKINALSIIDQFKIREFDWKDSGAHQKIGFVADELELLDSGLAIGGGWDEDGNIDAKGVNEFYLVGYLTKGIQELHAAQLSQADELLAHKSQIDYLLDENAALKKRVKELEKQIA